ncbi:SpoIIIAH-like family protein [Shouchella lonarensis]|uniref:Stage III sporulation protein AH n=1 Tax=Shouchella lonarensis TaxID=1464122 RepID=A0A1G6IDY7_9BACI|nr:SpoIIIAH-like family protein [Shouchella lonarensis]SDC04583.1 stage III sporulation protein AH [Shouchella lonarensis]
MVLKKQTVWLLTMLSLMLVLGAYYVLQERGPNSSLVGSLEEQKENGEDTDVTINVDEEGNIAENDADIISDISGHVNFTEARLKMDEARSKKAEEYSRKASDDQASAEEKVDAYNKSLEILAISTNEEMLESLIRAEGYHDALVMSQEDKVKVMVQAESLTPAQALDIMQLAEEQLQTTSAVSVQFEPMSK